MGVRRNPGRPRTPAARPRNRWEEGLEGIASMDADERSVAYFRVAANALRLRLLEILAEDKPVRPIDAIIMIGKKYSNFTVYSSFNILVRAGLASRIGGAKTATYYRITPDGRIMARAARDVSAIGRDRP